MFQPNSRSTNWRHCPDPEVATRALKGLGDSGELVTEPEAVEEAVVEADAVAEGVPDCRK